MEVHLLGVRGSTSAPGPDFVRFGGHTSCVAIARPNGRLLILDAGTGFRRVANLLDGAPLHASVLVTHLHWDHTEGLPFLPNADRDGADVHLYLPDQGTQQAAVDVLAGNMRPPHFPIRPEQLGGEWQFSQLAPGTYDIEGLQVTAAEVHHKGGRTFGYRIVDGDAAVVYISDHAFADAPADLRANAIELCRGADLLLHDAQFVDAQRAVATAFAHSTISDAIELARIAAVKHLVLTNHAPNREDVELDALADELARTRLPVSVAREGAVLQVTHTPE